MLLVLLVACGTNDRDLQFPAVLEPLEENLAPDRWPEDGEGFEVVSGSSEEWSWAHAKGLVHSDTVDAWRALRAPLVHINRREVDGWSVEEDVEPGFTDSFRVENTMTVFMTMSWDVVYVFEVQEGSDDAPVHGVLLWDLAEAPDMIEVLRGSAVLRTVDAEWTALELIVHVEAPTRGPADCEQLLFDVGEDWLDTVHERPLRSFDDGA